MSVTGETYEGLLVGTSDMLAYALASVNLQPDGQPVSSAHRLVRSQVREVARVLNRRGLTDAMVSERAAENRSKAAAQARNRRAGDVSLNVTDRPYADGPDPDRLGADGLSADGLGEGLQLLRDIALGHRASALWAGKLECTVCRAEPGSALGAAWPCPVWKVAALTGAVSLDGNDPDFGELRALVR